MFVIFIFGDGFDGKPMNNKYVHSTPNFLWPNIHFFILFMVILPTRGDFYKQQPHYLTLVYELIIFNTSTWTEPPGSLGVCW